MVERQLPKLDVASSSLVSRLFDRMGEILHLGQEWNPGSLHRRHKSVSLEPYPNG